MDNPSPPPAFDPHVLEEMNEKTIKNQFFTPDKVYIELGLLKDIPIGVIYADMMISNVDEETFTKTQKAIINRLVPYQKRLYDTVDAHFGPLGYKDDVIAAKLQEGLPHDLIFSVAPTSKFFDLLIRHTVLNQNNSRPAHKYVKTMLDKDQYVVAPIAVTYYINIYPLNLSNTLLTALAEELGESFGVNIQFLNKDPTIFDQSDWDDWMKDIDCYYFDNLGRFTRGELSLQKQQDMLFMGRFFFARKRFEKCVMHDMHGQDFEQQIQIATAQLDMFCDFAWLKNNDVRLTEEKEHVADDDPPEDSKK